MKFICKKNKCNYIAQNKIGNGLNPVRQYWINTNLFKDRNIRNHVAWTIGNVDPMHGVCIPHRIPRTWEQQG